MPMGKLAREHSPETPSDKKNRLSLVDIGEPPSQQFHRIGLCSAIEPKPPWMNPPSRTSERPAHVHCRAVAGEKAWQHQRWGPVLRPAWAYWPESGKHSRQVPRHLAHSMPSRRSNVVGINRCRSRDCGAHPFHALKDKVLFVSETISSCPSVHNRDGRAGFEDPPFMSRSVEETASVGARPRARHASRCQKPCDDNRSPPPCPARAQARALRGGRSGRHDA